MSDRSDDDRLRNLLERALDDLRRTRGELRAARATQAGPIAIVGMACRYPGNVDNAADLWSVVRDGRCVIGEFPDDRGWDLDTIYDPERGREGKSYTRRGGFVHDATAFDADLFGISPREATAMDPQQRLLLELSWRLFEDAGVNPDSLRETPTGVFTGLIAQEYGSGAGTVGPDDHDRDGYRFTGNTASVASGRISYTFGLRGPAISVDTACSSSLLAIHLACRSLRAGECDLAIAGGATILSTPTAFIEFSRQRALAADGRCKPFAAGADGTAWGEGGGLLLLQRLSDAERAGSHILAVIRGSAVNQDGASNGLTAPNGSAQQEVIRRALADAGCSPTDVDAVEAHGTGTTLGDPIEADALQATYGQAHTPDMPLWLGSIKSNIGHTAAAAGVAGVIKMVEAIRRGVLPPTLHIDAPTPHVDWSAGTVALLTERRNWPVPARPRRAGISAFGISGTNAHLIVEQAPPVAATEPADNDHRAWEGATAAIPVSAKDESRLQAFAQRLIDALAEDNAPGPHEVARTCALTRPRLGARAIILARDKPELTSGLSALAEGTSVPQLVGPAVTGGTKPPLAFVFPGQGGQYVGMARGLYRACPPFRGYLDACVAALAPHIDWSLLDVLLDSGHGRLLERVDVVQPVLFAVTVALAELWQHLGVTPDATIGHSQGEIAAAYVSGALSLQDAALVVARRSAALTTLAGEGTTMAVALPVNDVESRLACQAGRIALTAVNSPTDTVVSGDRDAVARFAHTCAAAGIRTRVLPVDYAAHSAHVDPVLARVRHDLVQITTRPCHIPFYSTVTGKPLTGDELDADYWCRNLRETVRFEPAVRALRSDGHAVFLEVGPHPVLTASIERIIEHTGTAQQQFLATGTLRRDRDDDREMLATAADLDIRGIPVRWEALHDGRTRDTLHLPGQPFDRKRLWHIPDGRVDVAAAGLDEPGHPLLAAAVTLPDGGMVFTGRISRHSRPWLADHVVAGTCLFPGMAFVDLALHAGACSGHPRVRELTLHTPLPIPTGAEIDLRVGVHAPIGDGRCTIEIHSRTRDTPVGEWIRHATGLLEPEAGATQAQWNTPSHSREYPLDADSLYRFLAECGYRYGPIFRGVRAGRRDGDDVLAELALPDTADASRFALHPALLDAALHAAVWARPHDESLMVPFIFRGVSRRGPGAATARIRVRRSPDDGSITLLMTNRADQPMLTIDTIMLRGTSAHRLIDDSTTGGLYKIVWTSLPDPDDLAPPVNSGIVVLRSPGEPITPPSPEFADSSAAAAALESAGPEPPNWDLALYHVSTRPSDSSIAERTATLLTTVTKLIQAWVNEPLLHRTRLVIVTRGAIGTEPLEHPTDPAAAAIWGLVRTAQLEEPDRVALVDLSPATARLAVGTLTRVATAIRSGTGQLAVRNGTLLVPSLIRAEPMPALPYTRSWRLSTSGDGLSVTPSSDADAPLASGQVRVRVRAAGLNFRDVLESIGAVATGAPIGDEIAGSVTEVADDVSDIAVGENVMGLASGGFGPVVVTDGRLLVSMPDDITFATAAGVCVAYLTAYYGLGDVGAIRPGDRVLIHAATGGVGLAALRLARHLGAEVYATASPGKWHILRATGLDDEHIGSSRDLAFEDHFRARCAASGFDLVLNSLAREFTDASLRLLRDGGTLIDLGKTDLRDPNDITTHYRGVRYRAIDLHDAGTPRLAELLRTILADLTAGRITPLPVTCRDISRAPEAFEHMATGRHVGKVVLTLPQPLDPDGTVLITGGTGALGSIMARHLVRVRGVRRLILAGRSPAANDHSRRIEAELRGLGATVTVAACDVADAQQAQRLLDTVPQRHPLTAIVHCAGVLDDSLLADLTPAQLERVLRPKVDAAWNLHRLTRYHDLAEFTLFSSLAGTLGNPGQANYAAANAFLDACAQQRAAEGLPALSIAWGLWSASSTMAHHADRSAIAYRGLLPLSDEHGVALYEAARSDGAPVAAAARFSRAHRFPAIDLPAGEADTRQTAGVATGGVSFRARFAATPNGERAHLVESLVLDLAATVLGHADTTKLRPDTTFQEQAFDSLTSVELRNKLARATGLALASTVVFDHPTPADLTEYVLRKLTGRLTTNAYVEAAVVAPKAEPVTKTESVTQTTWPVTKTEPMAKAEPVAIIGLGCRYPGGITSANDLWRLVYSGTDAITTFPTDRGWDVEALYNPDSASAGTSYTCHGGFLDDVAGFDAAFFGISPVEATAMDPQQRLLLETAWEALENAFLDPRTLRGEDVGVFTGVIAQNYAALASAASLEGYVLTGNAPSVASGRLAYLLGLHGPAVTVDTACSSSLVALHLAVAALRRGECSLALAGGAAVMPVPDLFVEFSRQRALAEDGRCKAFAAAADGTGWSEGAGQILLERLSDAERNGHRVLAIVRGSAINQDGASNGLTAPNGSAQRSVIIRALHDAGLEPDDIDAVEAHGTGTVLGDPIEAQALSEVYGTGRSPDRALWLGSIKSNIGHTQAASGAAGVIKLVEALRRGVLPQTLHADQPTRHIDWPRSGLALLAARTRWPERNRPRRAAVSSFGISGTNAHVILEQAPGPQPYPPRVHPSPVAWPVSAASEQALRAYASRLGDHLAASPDGSTTGVAQTLARRTSFAHRAVLIGTDRGELLAGLHNLARTPAAPGVVEGHATAPRRAVFVFGGQGSQWPGMAAGLFDESEVFRAAVDECDAAFQPLLGQSVADMVRTGPLDEDERVQPALFTMMVALAAVWRSHGVIPDAVVGHSQGEVAAACVAGALTVSDGARIVAARLRCLRSMGGDGAMVALGLPVDEVSARIGSRAAVIAAVNGPRSTVVSGDRLDIEAIVTECRADDVAVAVIPIGYASHSPQVDSVQGPLTRALCDIVRHDSPTPFYSTVTGDRLDTALLDADYWFRNLRQPVLFAATIDALLRDGFDLFIEQSPHPTLVTAMQGHAERCGRNNVRVLATLRRNDGTMTRMLRCLADAYVSGATVRWRPPPAQPHDLPTYPFQHRSYWARPLPRSSGTRRHDRAHPLLPEVIDAADGYGSILGGTVSLDTHPWLAGHEIYGSVLMPGTAFVDMALYAAEQVGYRAVDDLVIEAPLPLTETEPVRLQVIVRTADAGGDRADIAIYSRRPTDPSWCRHAIGGAVAAMPPPEPITTWPPVGTHPVPVQTLYSDLADRGLRYNSAFAAVHAAWQSASDNPSETFVELELPAGHGDDGFGGFRLHPALVDATLHVIAAASDERRLPFTWSGVSRYPSAGRKVRAVVTRRSHGTYTVTITDLSGNPVFVVDTLSTRPFAESHDISNGHRSGSLLQLAWEPTDLLRVGAQRRVAVITTGRDGLSEGLDATVFSDIHELRNALDNTVVPRIVLLVVDTDTPVDPATAARAATRHVLSTLRSWLADKRLRSTRLLILTRNAVAVRPGDDTVDPAAAALWGMVRAAQNEQPESFALIDSDGARASAAVLPRALSAHEPQLVLRAGVACRAALSPVTETADTPVTIRRHGTVLLTGATGGIGRHIARHLAARHRVGHIVLLARRQPPAAYLATLGVELATYGTEISFATCDVADRDAIATVIADIPEQHPLAAVVHAAGTVHDGLVSSLDDGALDDVMRPKVDGAWNLHVITENLDLDAFVLFSSAAGALGSPGQANYAAANAFLDALAHHRRSRGLPAHSIAWGTWIGVDGMADRTSDTHHLSATGRVLGTLTAEQGLELFDRALAHDYPAPIALGAGLDSVRTLDRLLRRNSAPRRPPVAADLTDMSPQDRRAAFLGLIRSYLTDSMGYTSTDELPVDAAFPDLGFSSLNVTELRNQLRAKTNLALSVEAVLEHATLAELADHLEHLMSEKQATGRTAASTQ